MLYVHSLGFLPLETIFDSLVRHFSKVAIT